MYRIKTLRRIQGLFALPKGSFSYGPIIVAQSIRIRMSGRNTDESALVAGRRVGPTLIQRAIHLKAVTIHCLAP